MINRASESELLEIGEAAERLLPNHHPLTIAIARARLDCAHALRDESLIAIRRERLERIEAQRAARLKATPITQGS